MFSAELQQYDALVKTYHEEVIDKMNADDYKRHAKILFSCHSCGIEGNTFTVDDTRALFEQQLGFRPVGRSLYECQEMADHFAAYEYTFRHLDSPLDINLVKEINRLVTLHTLTYKSPDAIPGEFTTVDMAAGDTVFGDHERLIASLPRLLDATQQTMAKGYNHPMIIAARFHGYFIYLHPFRDGNGRTARLLSNWILAKSNLPHLIITSDHREEYISALKAIRKEGTDEHLIHFFLQTAIQSMTSELEQKKKHSTFTTFLF